MLHDVKKKSIKKETCENCKYFSGATQIYDFPVILCKKSKEAKMLNPRFRNNPWEKYSCEGFRSK